LFGRVATQDLGWGGWCGATPELFSPRQHCFRHASMFFARPDLFSPGLNGSRLLFWWGSRDAEGAPTWCASAPVANP
jgi:hypothetical protein